LFKNFAIYLRRSSGLSKRHASYEEKNRTAQQGTYFFHGKILSYKFLFSCIGAYCTIPVGAGDVQDIGQGICCGFFLEDLMSKIMMSKRINNPIPVAIVIIFMIKMCAVSWTYDV
jgi:hypothetical protein